MWLSEIFRDRPLYLAVTRKSDWQSDLHLADHHANSQRTINVGEQCLMAGKISLSEWFPI